MNFEEYQVQAAQTAKFTKTEAYAYLVAALAEEVGEVCRLFAKTIRDEHGTYEDVDPEKLSKELGDVLWNVAVLCTTANLSLDDVATANIKKLADRAERGVLHGSGDFR